MAEDEEGRLARLKHNLKLRALIYHYTRQFFREQGFLEIETPVRMPVIIPESQITPVESEGWFLSTSPELHMKRLLAAGYDKIFQISRCFRKGERGRFHNPEFTLLEWYRAGADCRQMIQDTQRLVINLADKMFGSQKIKYQGRSIDLTSPWPGITVQEAFLKLACWDPLSSADSQRFDADLVTKVIPGLNASRPVVLMEYPASMASLACLKPGNAAVAERAEVFIAGLEMANAFTELGDSKEMEKRFLLEIEQTKQEQGRNMQLPSLFLEAVSRLPECGGIALGMDRLAMLLCDAGSIDEVLAFPAEMA